MKRVLRRVVLLVILGAVVNVAVAWGIAFGQLNSVSSGETETGYTFSTARARYWFVDREYRFGFEGIHSNWIDHSCLILITFGRLPDRPAEAVLPEWAVVADPERSESLSGTNTLDLTATGWPALSMWGGMRTLRPCKVSNSQTVEIAAYGIEFDPSDPVKRLPTRPIWWGFVFSTLFYALLLWLPFATFGIVRRRRRVRRGLCVRCGYPRGVSDVCSECGR